MTDYARISNGRVVELILAYSTTEADRPPAPTGLEADAPPLGEAEQEARAAQQALHDAFVPGEVPMVERFHADVFSTMVSIPAGQTVTEGMAYASGTGFSAYVPPPPTAAEVRQQRGDLLTATDWTQVPDSPQASDPAWKVYRQALRDLPKQAGFPTTVMWPVAPT